MTTNADQITIPEYNVEMSTPINQIKNREVNMNNLVKNVETNIENLERTRNIETMEPNIRVGGYQYEHQQLLNQANNPIIELENTNTLTDVNSSNIEKYIINSQNKKNIENISNNHQVKSSNYLSYIKSFIFNRDFMLMTLLFSLLSHRKFNTFVVRFIPIISDSHLR